MQNVRKQKTIALSLDTPSAINRANSLLLASMVIAALALVPGTARAQSAASNTSPTSTSTSAPASSTTQTATPEDSLAAAARKAKEAKAQSAKPAKVFTNDNLPTNGVISTVGAKPADNSTADTSSPSASSGQGEKYWRDKFATLNKKLEQDQSELDVMQRELGQLNLQNYGDPVQAMQQGLTRSDINDKTAAIDAKQKAVDADKQAIEDAQDDLRKSGGDSGWGR